VIQVFAPLEIPTLGSIALAVLALTLGWVAVRRLSAA
jgi:hypothetical protein